MTKKRKAHEMLKGGEHEAGAEQQELPQQQQEQEWQQDQECQKNQASPQVLEQEQEEEAVDDLDTGSAPTTMVNDVKLT